jgi:MFS superfamily sulfate permease-like transporter
LISAPVLTGFKIGVGLSIVLGHLEGLLGVSNEEDRDALSYGRRSPRS